MRILAVIALVLNPALVLADASGGATVQVNGPRISLGDLLGTAQTTDLGPAAGPGQVRRITRATIAYLVPELRSSLPNEWIVETHAQTLSCDDVLARVRETVQPSLANGLEVTSVSCQAPLVLPVGSLSVNARLPQRTQMGGSFTLPLEFSVGEWPVIHRSFLVTIGGATMAHRLVVAAPRGANIANLQLANEQVSAGHVSADTVTSLDSVHGYVLNRPLAAGTTLRSSMLTRQPLVERNTEVTVSAELPGVRVTSRGIANGAGALGEWIPVLCLSSHKMIRARVVAPRTVAVDL